MPATSVDTLAVAVRVKVTPLATALTGAGTTTLGKVVAAFAPAAVAAFAVAVMPTSSAVARSVRRNREGAWEPVLFTRISFVVPGRGAAETPRPVPAGISL